MEKYDQYVMMDLTNKMPKYYVGNYMEIQELFLSLKVTSVLIKTSGLTMLHALEQKIDLQIARTADGVFIIVIQLLNVFKYIVVVVEFNRLQL